MEQTNRTILFEEINPDKLNLLSLITNESVESINDDELTEMHSILEVSSFKDALEKFQPTIYIALDSMQKKVLCTKKFLECQSGKFREIIPIRFDNENKLLKLFTNTLSRQKYKNSMCSAENISRTMFTLPDSRVFKKNINNIIRHIISGKEGIAKKEFNQLISQFDNSLFLIQIFLSEIQKLYENSEVQNNDKIIVLENKEEMEVSVFRCSEYFYLCSLKLSEEQKKEVEQFVEKNIHLESVYNPEIWKALFSVYEENTKQELITLYEEYSLFYKEIVMNFWGKCSDLLETLLGIYAYFDQYDAQEKLMPPRMIIANMSPETIIDIRNRNKLLVYLTSVNYKNYGENIIWYAIIPKLIWEDNHNSKNMRERFIGNDKQIHKESNSIQSVHVLANILADYQIQVFICPIIADNTTNRYVAKNGIDEWITYQLNFADREHSKYIYPCMPNFTLIPAEHTAINIAKKIVTTEWGEVVVNETFSKVWLKTVGIGAAYVAAGLFAACQCPGYLKEHHKKNVDERIPGVGYRIMSDRNNYKTYATLKMDIMKYQADVVESLNTKKCGIVFMPYRYGSIILSDSSASWLYGQKDTISDTQTVTYMERKIRYETQDFKSGLIKQFFQNRPGSIQQNWSENSDMVNGLLKKGERLDYIINEDSGECTFEIYFEESKKQQVVKLNQ